MYHFHMRKLQLYSHTVPYERLTISLTSVDLSGALRFSTLKSGAAFLSSPATSRARERERQKRENVQEQNLDSIRDRDRDREGTRNNMVG